jgi:hypothetical protein
MKPSWSIFDCRQLISFRLPLTPNPLGVANLQVEARLFAIYKGNPCIGQRPNCIWSVLVEPNLVASGCLVFLGAATLSN